ncbi:MAG: toll/interleukin-1 receptor domain-containing protein [Deltaproteobacteria bacterium]|nr:toll/interleukin-1 receptor domain-containing protein [Deltaproteobacteria bacterium]
MADICVIYDSKDKKVTSRLVSLLRNQWEVWWAEDDIPQGDWEQQVREQISQANAVVPVLSFHTEKNDVFKDELEWAKKCDRLIFPFFISKAEVKQNYLLDLGG